jgi:hypothetical protein
MKEMAREREERDWVRGDKRESGRDKEKYWESGERWRLREGVIDRNQERPKEWRKNINQERGGDEERDWESGREGR